MIVHGHVAPESDLGRLAKEARIDAGVSQAEAARRLGVSQPVIAQAENEPKRSLTALRLRMIAELSGGYEFVGPYFICKRKADKLKDKDVYM